MHSLLINTATTLQRSRKILRLPVRRKTNNKKHNSYTTLWQRKTDYSGCNDD